MASAPVPSSLRTALPTRRAKSSFARQEAMFAYIFLLPWIIGFIVFVAGPILASLGLSLTEYDIVKPPVFIGFANYIRAFTDDPLFFPSILRTFEYAVVIVPLGV